MTDIEERGRKFSLALTSAIFLIFFILCLVIRIKPKETYKAITIQLDSTPVIKDKPKTTTKKSEVAKKSESVKTENKSEKKVEKKSEKKQEEKKTTQTNKSSTKPSEKKADPKAKNDSKAVQKKADEPVIKKSVEELMAEQNSARKKKVEFDESLFADDAEPVQTVASTTAKKAVVAKSSLSGSSASAASQSSSSSLASSSSSADQAELSASDSTKNALSGIRNTTYSSSVADGIKSRASISSAKSATGAVSIQMSDGSSRQLLYPKNPSIFISEENARLVDSTRNVEIRFVVQPDGSVPFGEIAIRPASLLPDPIQREIKKQISEWKFSEDPSGRKGIAAFDYTLEIR